MVEFPETRLVRRSFTIREMDLPPEVQLTRRSMLRWFALSFGLISEKESRSTMIDVLDALFHFQFSKNKDPTAKELAEHVKKKSGKSISEKLLRYHLNRLFALNLIKRKQKKYSFNPSPYADRKDFKASFNYWIREHLEKSLKDIEFAIGKLEKSYSG